MTAFSPLLIESVCNEELIEIYFEGNISTRWLKMWMQIIWVQENWLRGLRQKRNDWLHKLTVWLRTSEEVRKKILLWVIQYSTTLTADYSIQFQMSWVHWWNFLRKTTLTRAEMCTSPLSKASSKFNLCLYFICKEVYLDLVVMQKYSWFIYY